MKKLGKNMTFISGYCIPWILYRSLNITNFITSDHLDLFIKVVDSSCFLLYLLSGVICVECLKDFDLSMWFLLFLVFGLKIK